MGKKIVSWFLLIAVVALCCGCGPNGTGRKVPVTFQLNNGEGEVVVEMNEGVPMKNAPVPSMRGCEFVGWYYEKQLWDMENGLVTEGMVLSAKWKITSAIYDKDPNAGTLSAGTDLRVCSFNVLKVNGANVTPLTGRIDGLHGMINEYAMDIVAFQEFDSNWKSAFRGAFAEENYRLLSQDLSDVTSAFLDIAYRADKLTVLACGVEKYTTPLDYSSEFAWATFEWKDGGGETFTVVTQAWHHNDQEARIHQSEILAQWLSKVKGPVISMGDYNEFETGKACKKLFEAVELFDAKYTAKRFGLVGMTFHGMPESESYTDEQIRTTLCIDHIFYTQEFSALYYDTITNDEVLQTSDHNPVYADLKLN